MRSSVPGEGKTSTASNTALALQTAGQRTLLVDADLRRPQLAKLFGLEGSVGLTSVLLGRIELKEAVQDHHPSGLSVLTSGTLPPFRSRAASWTVALELEATSIAATWS